MSQQNVEIVFPHQLFWDNPLLHPKANVYLLEEFLFFSQYRFHKQKLVFHRASMKYYEQLLRDRGIAVTYIQAGEAEADVRTLISGLSQKGVQSITIVDPTDDWLKRRVVSACSKANIQLTVLETPMFLNSAKDLAHYFKPEKAKYFQTDFYKKERIRRNLLLTSDGTPEGDKWSFDEENRKKFPKGKTPVEVVFPFRNQWVQEACDDIEKHFANHPGSLDSLVVYPTTHSESEEWLNQFLENRFKEFGDYEDAIVHRQLVLHHSVLTPMLNVGLLTPEQVLSRVLEFRKNHLIPINALEGFIRQIVGWREFIRGVYVAKGRQQRTRNFWGFRRKLPKSFYEGNTGIFPVDVTIQKVLKTGYCHHIERLMVLGNFMLLCEFDPDEVYRWFMELYVDAYDWVMVPNVYGMSQFADGGMMSTKPYLSGSNYLMKMSDYPKGEWQEIWDALFWRFLDRHRKVFAQNPRMGMLLKTFDQWSPDKKAHLLALANGYLERLDRELL